MNGKNIRNYSTGIDKNSNPTLKGSKIIFVRSNNDPSGACPHYCNNIGNNNCLPLWELVPGMKHYF
jgi:hypothetical protein